MLVWLAEYLVRYETAFNAISYITVRAILALLTALFISKHHSPRFSMPCFFKFTRIIEIAAGVMPEIRLA